MLTTQTAGSTRKSYAAFLLALLLGLLLPVAASPQPAYAQAVELGYLWSLDFTFDNDYNALLTIEVGPWENGDLVEVTEVSTAIVKCSPSGDVTLKAGSAVFNAGGYLECEMDLAAIVAANHGLQIDPVDTYGSIILRTRLNGSANALAPIFTHPDAAYSLDFTQTSAVTMNQQLWNGLGVSQAAFPGITINTWNTYTFFYRCISNGGPCDMNFAAAAQTNSAPTAGSYTQFSTGPTGFLIGSNGATTFTGSIDHLLVDPGNSAH